MYFPNVPKPHSISVRVSAVILLLFLATVLYAVVPTFNAFLPSDNHLQRAIGGIPLSFETNVGQTDERVAFLSRGSDYTLFLTTAEIVLKTSNLSTRIEETASSAVVRISLAGANPQPFLSGEKQLSGVANYFLGNEPADWYTNIPTYAAVRYADVYPGIDLFFYGNQGQLEYDFIITSGVDPDLIRLDFQGAQDIMLDQAGNLILATEGGKIVQQAPIIYQDVNKERQIVSGGYLLLDENQVGFYIGDYDPELPLIIDPVLIYSTYYGGSGGENIFSGVAADQNGNAYITGNTVSTDFPVVGGVQATHAGGLNDAFVVKLDPAGSTVLYATYLGGSDVDYGIGIDVDGNGNAYITGNTKSTDFPLTNATDTTFGGGSNFGDAFITQLNPTGSIMVHSTYLGGTCDDRGWDIFVDGVGQAFVTGETGNCNSNNFPAVNAFDSTYAASFDAFLTQYAANGTSILYSTYLGDSSFDAGRGVAVDATGLVYLAGMTQSTSFPTTANAYQPTLASPFLDTYLTVLDLSTNTLVYSTFLGGSTEEQGHDVALDQSGNAYVVGQTNSSDFPTVNPIQSSLSGSGDAFVVKIDPTQSGTASLIYATYLGGTGFDRGLGVAVNAAGEAFVTGQASNSFPLVDPLPAAPTSGSGFLTKYNAAGNAYIYSTYIGFAISEGVDVDPLDNAYVTGQAGSNSIPIINAVQSVHNGGGDAFVMKIASAALPTNTPVPSTNTPTSTETNTPTNTPTSTFTSTPTNTPTATATPTDTPTPTVTATPADNESPIITNVEATPNPVLINTPFQITAIIDDTTTGNSNLSNANYTIDGGALVSMSASDGAFDEPSEDIEATISGFTDSAVVEVCVTGEDVAGNISESVCILVAIYDPDSGFVTGGGWINSPAGAYVNDPSLSGRANFGFVSKYKKGANIPTGQTEFRFALADLDFHSDSYQWLVVNQGGTNAQYKGDGTINGTPSPSGGLYKFMIWAKDGDPNGDDTFRIKIWWEDTAGNEILVYDNGFDQPINGGNIKVHVN